MLSKQDYRYHWEPGSTSAHAYTWRRIEALLPKNTRLKIADLGCGNGYLTSLIHSMAHNVVGVDSSLEGIKIARESYPFIQFYHADITSDMVTTIGEDFDVVIAADVIEHLFLPAHLLASSRSLLKKNGLIILSTPYHGYFKNLVISLVGGWDKHFNVFWDGGHIKYFSYKTLSEMMKSQGYNDIICQFAGRFPPIWKTMILLGRKTSE